MRKMRQGLPCLDHDSGQTRRPDRSAQYRLLHRLRTLRGRLPDRSVRHSSFPPDKSIRSTATGCPRPNRCCSSARHVVRTERSPTVPSRRKRSTDPRSRPPAPTASNRQEVSFTVITDPAILDKIIRFTLDTFAGIARKLENPLVKPILKRLRPEFYNYLPAFKRLIAEYDKGNDSSCAKPKPCFSFTLHTRTVSEPQMPTLPTRTVR